ncbi:MAG: diacylglycerol kinase family lipid kinase [bacterium]|nr:diacylglycerol kinase family lipid kinase [bacterium]
MDWIVIVNPVSGKSRGKRLAESVVRFLAKRGVTAEPVFTTGPGDGTRLARQAVAEGIRQVAVCGGDGTVHEVVNGLVGSDAVLGIVPSGRGNDLARVLGIPGDVESASAVLMDGVDRQIDLGRIGDRYFGTVATLGFDSVVARWTYDRGARFYVLAVLKTLRTYRCPTVRLEGDFGRFEGPILLVATGNGGFYGAGMQIVPQAICDDGVLDVCLVKAVSKATLLSLFPRVFWGGHGKHPAVQMFRTKTLRIVTEEPLEIFADGEPVCCTPATINVVPGVLNVRVGKQGFGQ